MYRPSNKEPETHDYYMPTAFATAFVRLRLSSCVPAYQEVYKSFYLTFRPDNVHNMGRL
jgi:hypothetical protein